MATTYYVGSGGSDSATGLTWALRWLTYAHAGTVMTAGDILLSVDPATVPASTYATTAALKSHSHLNITDAVDDTYLAGWLIAASRAIDKETGRFFYPAGAQTRYFDAADRNEVMIDDCLSVTSLTTDADGSRSYATTWATTDYDLLPYNAPLEAEPEPYTSITRSSASDLYFPAGGNITFPINLNVPSHLADSRLGHKSIKVIGTWGWSAVPSMITQAVLLLADRWFNRPKAIFGVVGSADMGQISAIVKTDPDIQAMLKNYKKLWFG